MIAGSILKNTINKNIVILRPGAEQLHLMKKIRNKLKNKEGGNINE